MLDVIEVTGEPTVVVHDLPDVPLVSDYDVTALGPFDASDPRRPSFGRHSAVKMLKLLAADIPVPLSAAVEIEKTENENPDSVHILKDGVRATMTVLASPGSGDYWNDELLPAITSELEEEGFSPELRRGIFGYELLLFHSTGFLRFIGRSLPRMTVRMTLAGDTTGSVRSVWAENMFSDIVISRDDQPMPVGEPLNMAIVRPRTGVS